jgi:hypothetical protein
VEIPRNRDRTARGVRGGLAERLVDRHPRGATLRDPSSRACTRSGGR